LLLMRRENVDNPVHGGSRIGGMQGRKHQMTVSAMVRRRRWFPDRAFPDQDHVRVLAQGVLERGAETLGLLTQLALADHAVLILVDKFDRIFNRQDVLFALFIDQVDQTGEGGGFSRTCGPVISTSLAASWPGR